MSLWSHDRIRIVLGPQEVAAVRIAGSRGRRVRDKRLVTCTPPPPARPLWEGALAALEAILPEVATRKADVTVILSNHFVRYALVDHSDQIDGEDEERALVRHHFERVYGPVVEDWTLCLSFGERPGAPRVACAVDRELPASLRRLVEPTGLPLRSIQPHLMAVFNQLRHRLKRSAWFVLVEQGELCLARFAKRRWVSLRTLRIGDDWVRELAVELEREQLLGGDKAGTRIPIYVFAPGCPETLPDLHEGIVARLLREHSVRLLRPLVPRADSELSKPSYAIALIG